MSIATTGITTTVEAGKIVLPQGVDWPDGTVVRVEPVEEHAPTIWDALKEFDGIINDPRTDMAANHNHYLHGHRKA